MNKHDLIQKVKALEGISQDERAYLIDLINTKRKYGLVWEDKPEDVEETLRQHLPVLQEVVEKRILSEPGFRGLKDEQDSEKIKHSQPSLFDEVGEETNQKNSDNYRSDKKAVNHTLIEGDNLHALTALTFTHENKIDVIYIDPPYNTGNKDFKYNDSFVDKEDAYRHSKWLSFMDKRLRIAKRLLSDKGVIFISIDDNEQAQLKLLCDEVFGEVNFTGNIVWKKKTNGNNMGLIPPVHDFIVAYSKGIEVADIQGVEFSGEYIKSKYSNLDNDIRGDWTTSDLSANHVGPYFEIINPQNGQSHFPPKGRYWVFNEDEVKKRIDEGRIIFGKNGNGKPIQKKFLSERMNNKKRVETWWDNHGLNSDGSAEVAELIDAKKFVHPKPTKLIKRILGMIGSKDSTILDFFAGSGTTLHATMALNAEDGGSRQCILVTNNENNICEEVTYERNKRVIEGYYKGNSLPTGEGRGGVFVPGLSGNNLRYYRSSFVPSIKSETNKRLLTQASTELLCIKENCYNELTAEHELDPRQARIFRDDSDGFMVVVYHSRQQAEVCEALVGIIEGLSSSQKIKLYGFSPEKDTLVEEFYGVQDRIEAIPLPDAIYNAYKATFRIMGLDKKQS